MAKKNQPVTPPVRRTPASAQTSKSVQRETPEKERAWRPLLVALIVTALCYLPSLSNELVNWDDDPNITENPNLIRVGQGQTWGETFSKIFDEKTGNVIGNYNPMPILTFAVEKSISGGEFDKDFIRMVHTDNLLLHLLVVLFSFIVLRQLGVKPLWAGFGALLMGIHPMRVESVAWATERKDVLFAAFFFASMAAYIRYLQLEKSGSKWLWFGLSLLLGVLSLYSKVQAVTLVVSLWAIDYYFRRPLSAVMVLEKIPLLAASVMMGLTNLRTLAAQGSTNDDITGFNAWDRICVGSWQFSVYMYKLLIPNPMSPLYPYPKPLLYYHRIAPFLFLGAILLFVWAAVKDKRKLVFGAAFFALNVVLLLQFFGAGQGYLADRFTYVPYFGFFFVAAWYMSEWYDKSEKNRTMILATAGILLAVYAFMTVKQVKIWENGDTLWTHVIKVEGTNNSLPYWNRGQYRRKQGDFDRAIADYNQAVNVNPKNPELYNSRGKTYFDLAMGGKVTDAQKVNELISKAIADYNKAVELGGDRPKVKSEALINRGAAYGAANRFQEALRDLNEGLSVEPDNKNGYFNRSIVYFQSRNFPMAIADYEKYLTYDPYNYNIRYELGMTQRVLGRNDEAVANLTKTLQIKSDMGLAYLERARAHAQAGRKNEASRDYQQAKNFGSPPQAFDQQLMGN